MRKLLKIWIIQEDLHSSFFNVKVGITNLKSKETESIHNVYGTSNIDVFIELKTIK